MQFSELADAVLEADIFPIINDLLYQKKNNTEMSEGKRIDELNAYIDKNLVQLKASVDTLPNDHHADWNKLNKVFLSIVNKGM